MYTIFSTEVKSLLIVKKKENPAKYFVFNMDNGAYVPAKDVQAGTYICELETLEELNILLCTDLDI